ncbi:DNA-binding CsgD family transcriptional regulator [Actinoplanes octamycinicus]|uniref:DNA-binding CsgD family transcriptional regulator n=1 Tax=Actinoplanes octamycinicus TaxID=135948 RepID=A0A7W7H6R4_9ACTN|nr:LuxR family transcriptional regulator [Actinoplanes octamycinicus]MBB4745041.1 DNA-binding CsgD family transcriptional regulator [Actinoplanes octamycinicus]GIE55628.1 LuxR family transcriptional regulator [Actinoplanes octamycinicus]
MIELRGRGRERDQLDRLLQDVRAGQSRVLVLRGEAGAGKSALLDYLAGHAPAGRVVRAAGVEPETELAYSALQQLVAPLLPHLDRLPEPQRAALSTAFGLAAGRPPEALLIGLAVLGLLAEAAVDQPLVVVVDDAQWLDRMSEVILTFVARRLDAESVALVFAARTPADDALLTGLPELRVEGLPEADARALLDTVLPGLVDARVRDRIVDETRGNPLALLELPRELDPADLAFGFGTPGPVLAGRLELGFERRIAALPADTRTLLLTAAVEPIGNVPLLWKAVALLGVSPEAAGPAEAAGLVEIGARVRFRHPLVRSAAWHRADPAELRAVHRALAEVTDAVEDPDRRAWHRGHAAAGPDEAVAAELENSAGRALARGGRAAAAAFLERAAELTPDPSRRTARMLAAAQARLASGAAAAVPGLLAAVEMGPLDPVQQAGVERLRAQVAFVVNSGREVVPPLLAAAGRLRGLDPVAARETYLSAVGAAINAGRLGSLDPAIDAAASAPAGEEPAGLLLTSLITWHRAGHAAAVPAFREALDAVPTDNELDLLWLTGMLVHEVFDDAAFQDRTEQAVTYARAAGELSRLPSALTFRSTALIYAGRFADASDLIDEAAALARATGPAPHPASASILAAFRGRTGEALALIDELRRDATAGGVGWLLSTAAYSRAVLHNGHGDYAAAMAAAREAAAHEDLAVLQWSLGELVEAAARAGSPAVAAEARDRLVARAAAVDTAWARGVRALADALVDDRESDYREAVEQFAASRHKLQLARARLVYGEWLRRANRRGEARDQLRPAYEAFSTMGAEGFAERAGRELTATGETVRKRSAGTAEELTPQESQIARLAASGRTNPEIGAVLFLSPRTVEWHLRKIFTKLGVTSRRELPAAVGRW